jgi:tetratricopeptide (TPR) repeat protein
MALAEAGRGRESEAWLALAGRSAKEVGKARLSLGDVALASGRTDEAARQYAEAARLWPGLTAAHVALGDLALGRGRPDEAAAHYQDALRFRPDLPAALAGLRNARAVQTGVHSASPAATAPSAP